MKKRSITILICISMLFSSNAFAIESTISQKADSTSIALETEVPSNNIALGVGSSLTNETLAGDQTKRITEQSSANDRLDFSPEVTARIQLTRQLQQEELNQWALDKKMLFEETKAEHKASFQKAVLQNEAFLLQAKKESAAAMEEHEKKYKEKNEYIDSSFEKMKENKKMFEKLFESLWSMMGQIISAIQNMGIIEKVQEQSKSFSSVVKYIPISTVESIPAPTATPTSAPLSGASLAEEL